MRSVRLVPQAISRFDKEYILRLTHHTRFCRRRKRCFFFSKMFVYNKCGRKHPIRCVFIAFALCILLLPHSIDTIVNAASRRLYPAIIIILLLSERVLQFYHARVLCVQRLSQIVFITVVGIIKQTILKCTVFFFLWRWRRGAPGPLRPHHRTLVCDKGVATG